MTNNVEGCIKKHDGEGEGGGNPQNSITSIYGRALISLLKSPLPSQATIYDNFWMSRNWSVGHPQDVLIWFTSHRLHVIWTNLWSTF